MDWLYRLRAWSALLLFLTILGASLLDAAPAMAQANAPVGGGGSCSAQTEPDGTQGVQQAYDNGLYTCSSSAWVPEAFMVGSVLQNGSAATCSSTYAGMIQWTGSVLQYCGGTSWITLAGTGAGLDLGTSAVATNPQRTGDATTGLFSPTTGAVAVASGGSEIMRVNATGLGIGSTIPAATLDVSGAMYSRRVALTDGATIAVNWSQSNIQSVTLGGNRTFTFSNPVDGARYILIIKQDGTGSRTATWPGTVRWPGGTAPTLTTTASKTDYITFIYNGVSSTYDGVAISQNF
jgi:hypothetical protein